MLILLRTYFKIILKFDYFFPGLLSELQDVSCKVLNCTWDITEPQDGYGWGVKPISGPYNQSGVWGGVFGGIINGGNLSRGIENRSGAA